MLTTEIKFKTAIFYEKVKITISTDGNKLEWYKAKDKYNASENTGTPLGTIIMKKVNNISLRLPVQRQK